MATYAIGDIQGCHASLMALLERIRFDPKRDRLWLVGDLVNRGPDSLAVLRWALAHEKRVVCVLGNHDIHLLSRGLAGVENTRRDTLDELLDAPDREALLRWLRHRPLLHREGKWVLVHGGLHPSWSLDEAETHAREVETVLRSKGAAAFLGSYRESAPHWRPELAGQERLSTLASVFTRLRCMSPGGRFDFQYTGPLDRAHDMRIPWWRLRHQDDGDATILFGHWAAIGFHREPGIVALDSGCVWGGPLTAFRLEDETVFQVQGHG